MGKKPRPPQDKSHAFSGDRRVPLRPEQMRPFLGVQIRSAGLGYASVEEREKMSGKKPD